MFSVYGFIIYKDGCIRSLHCDEELVKFNDYKQIEKFIDSLLVGEYN